MTKFTIFLFIALSLSRFASMSPVSSQNSSENVSQENDIMSLDHDGESEETDASEYPGDLIEEIKSRILKGLHKTEAPRTHVPLPVLQTLNFRNASEEITEEINLSSNEKTETDFVAANVDNSSCIDDNGLPCVKINFNLNMQNSFRRTEMWLYKNEGITDFLITHIFNFNGTNEKRKLTIAVHNQNSTKGWIRFNVTSMLSVESVSVLEFQTSLNTIETSPEEEDKKPFLLIHSLSDLKSISKRSASYCANDSSTCCRQKYFIKFKDINWAEWIVQPEGYEANFCKGTCNNSIGLSNSHHARVFMALCENNPEKFKLTGKTECLTCVPTAYRSISVIYLDEDGVQVVSHLPGMSVIECGCA